MGEIRLVSVSEEEALKEKEDQKNAQRNGVASLPKKVENIAFSFQDYLRTIKKLKIFQNTNDSEAYKEWRGRRGQEGVRLFIALRKLEKGMQGADPEALRSKYTELAQKEDNITSEQVKNLHQHIKCFDDMQLLLARFSQAVRKQSRDIAQAIQALWPELKSILDGEWSAELMLSRLELPILKISDLSTQVNIKRLLNALFERAEMISRQHLESQS